MKANGTRVKRLTGNPAGDSVPAPSRGGKRVADFPVRTGNWDPAWSPDGKRIAFASDRAGNWEVYVMKPDGTRLKRLTKYGGRDGEPAWSPDGEHIVFSRSEVKLLVMKADGTRVMPL